MDPDQQPPQTVVVRKVNGTPEFVGIAGVGTKHEVVVYAMSTFRVLTIRVLRVYIQSFLGLLSVDGLGIRDLAPPGEAFDQMWVLAGIALAPAFIALLMNLLEFLTKLDVSTPSLHA